jgi:hypothetical protein
MCRLSGTHSRSHFDQRTLSKLYGRCCPQSIRLFSARAETDFKTFTLLTYQSRWRAFFWVKWVSGA